MAAVLGGGGHHGSVYDLDLRVWQCAHNAGNDLWSNLARFLTLVWALNIGVVGGFLLVDLMSG